MNKIEEFLSVYDTIDSKNKFLYLSCPMMHGPKFIKWYNEIGKTLAKNSEEYNASHHENVFVPNIEHAIKMGKSIFLRSDESLINPVKIKASLSQDEYHLFWIEVIKKYTKGIVFIPGWAYSKGCLIEMLTALANNIPIYDMSLQKLAIDETKHTLQKAHNSLSEMGLKSELQTSVLEMFNRV